MPSVRTQAASIYTEVSLTVAADDQLVLYGVRTTGSASTANAFGGASLAAPLSTTAVGAGPFGMLWGKVDPDGSPGAGSQTFVNTTGTIRGSAGCILTDVDEASPYRAVNTNQTGSGTTGQSCTLAGTVAGDLVLAFIYGSGFVPAELTAESGTALVTQSNQDSHAIGILSKEATGASTTLNFAYGTSSGWIAHMLAVQAPSGGEGGGVTVARTGLQNLGRGFGSHRAASLGGTLALHDPAGFRRRNRIFVPRRLAA